MEAFTEWLVMVKDMVWGVPLIVLILGCGLWLTVRVRLLQVFHLGKALRFMIQNEEEGHGEVTSFGALCTALSATIGTGNIVGVASAICAGGPGALFWMEVAAFFGMATKYGEIVLGMLYREKNEEGNFVGGPMYYIKKGLHLPWLAVLTAFFMVTQIIGGNFIQSNTISGVMKDNFSIPPLATGIALVILIFVITLGGLKRLAHVAQRLVPSMALLYVVGGLIIILANITKLPGVFAEIFTGAFGLRAAAGGALGSMIMAMQKGVARGLYSNEAGEGSAPVIHSAAEVNHPSEQGITGVVEVFLDTFVICTITGLTLGVTGVLDSGVDGSVLAIYAFGSVWPPLRYVVSVCLLMFCFTTLMSQWYFGFVGLNYIFGVKAAEKFKYVFPCFCVIGALTELELVWTIQDIALGLLTLPNLVALVFLAPQVRRATKEFFNEI